MAGKIQDEDDKEEERKRKELFDEVDADLDEDMNVPDYKAALNEENSDTKTEQKTDEKKKDFTIEQKQELLVLLGFARYDNKEKGIKFVKTVSNNIKVGKTYKTDKKGAQWWAYDSTLDPSDKNRLVKAEDIAKIPIVKMYMEITNHMLPIPAQELIGHIKELHGDQIVINFETKEHFEESEARYGKGAIKSDDNGHYIPHGYSKDKLKLPRNIRLPDCESELKSAPQMKKKESEVKPTSLNIGKHPNNTEKEDGENPDDAEVAEMKQHKRRMQLAFHASVSIIKEEVEGEIPNQGLAGVVKDVAIELLERLETRIAGSTGGKEMTEYKDWSLRNLVMLYCWWGKPDDLSEIQRELRHRDINPNVIQRHDIFIEDTIKELEELEQNK